MYVDEPGPQRPGSVLKGYCVVKESIVVMRKKLLSLLMACVVSLTVLGLHHALKTDHEGTAFASIDRNVEKGHEYSRAEQKNLRRSISYHPENLLKMNGRDVRGVLSEPGLVRKDSPTIVWQYRSESCVLDLYFSTMEKDADLSPVIHYEMRAREKGVDDEAISAVCVREIVQAHNGPRMVGAGSFYKSP